MPELRTAMSMAWLWRSMMGRPYPLSVIVPLKPEFVAMAIWLTVQTPPQRFDQQIGLIKMLMSAFGTKRTSDRRLPMSAFGGKADIAQTSKNVRF